MNAHAVQGSDLLGLLSRAARRAPDEPMIRDDEGVTTAADLVHRVHALSEQLRSGGLQLGERVVVVAGAQAPAIVEIAAVLDAGLEPVVVPCRIAPVDLARLAQAVAAVALVGPARYGDLDLADAYLSAAALAETVRGVLTHGAPAGDGAIDISFAALDALSSRSDRPDLGSERPTFAIATFAATTTSDGVVWHQPAKLVAEARALADAAGIDTGHHVVSLASPASHGGMVASLSAIVGRARLAFHGPFVASRFLTLWDEVPSAHLATPAGTAPVLVKAVKPKAPGSVIVLNDADGARDDAMAKPELPTDRPVVDVVAQENGALRIEPRRPVSTLGGDIPAWEAPEPRRADASR